MNYRLVEEIDRATAARYDALMERAPNAHFTQHPAWVGVPSESAGRWLVFLGEQAGDLKVAGLVRVRRAPVVGCSLLDLFRGPVAESPADLFEGLAALKDLAAATRPLAIRIDPYWSGPDQREVADGLSRLGYAPSSDPLWSSRSLEIPIDRDSEEMLRTFSSDARSNVRKGLRFQIQVKEDAGEACLATLESLYSQMAATREANPRPAGFFRGIGEMCRAWPRRGMVLSSWLEGEALGAIVVFTLGRRAIYAYGASSAGKPKVPKSHLLQYTAMQRARDRGCLVYDMGGFGAGAGEKGGQTRVQRINYFKSGFGGREIDFVPAHELILRPVLYRALRSINRIRSRGSGGPSPGGGEREESGKDDAA